MMSYNQNVIVEKNITLSFEFERYVLEHPDILTHLPDGAEVVLLPKDDLELYRFNLNAARRAQQESNAPPIVFIEIEGLLPTRSRLINPHLTQRPSLVA